ncbi:single-stranded DNA-binding protein [Clostridium tunisiense]|uniref:single-stranded DNA-binding protein n=1 Tax=Clostridium tunisiense TaxID=219748 RepID=UPI0002EF59B5|nr:single-stranded DNA-binding protein [Clostridium tunisiense]
MNKVVLIGRLTRDPILNFTPGTGTAVTKFTLAVNRIYKKEGQPEADFIPVVVWGKQAESTANHKRKGEQIAVSGRIEVRSYDKDGERRYTTEIVADEVYFIGSTKNQQDNSNSVPDDYFGSGFKQDDSGEDIPF